MKSRNGTNEPICGQQWYKHNVLEYLSRDGKHTILDQAEREIGNVYNEGGGVYNLRINGY